MQKNMKTIVLSIVCIMVASTSQLVLAQETPTDGEYHNPSPEEIAAQQSEEWNPETGQFEPAAPLALGDSMADLVYTPVTPCRVVNTTLGTGDFAWPITGGTTLPIDMALPI